MNATKQNKRKWLFKFPRFPLVRVDVAQVIKALATGYTRRSFQSVGSNPGLDFSTFFFPLFFFFFCLPLYYLFVNKKNVYVDLSRRTMLVRSADQRLASPFFLHLTTRLGRFFLIH